MNLHDIKLSLFNFFKFNDQFIYPDDRLKIITISDTPELHYSAILEALKLFEETKIVSKIEFAEGKTKKIGYILEKPVDLYTQSLQLPGDFALEISNIINSLNVPNTETKKFVCNPFSITLSDLEILLLLARAQINQSKNTQNTDSE
jgi:hypothetical protein